MGSTNAMQAMRAARANTVSTPRGVDAGKRSNPPIGQRKPLLAGQVMEPAQAEGHDTRTTSDRRNSAATTQVTWCSHDPHRQNSANSNY